MPDPMTDAPELELPIIFQPDMVRAILREPSPEAPVKTQTRRMTGLEKINENPDQWEFLGVVGPDMPKHKGFYTGLKKGRLYTSFLWGAGWYEMPSAGAPLGDGHPLLPREWKIPKARPEGISLSYRADSDFDGYFPAIHMPRWASRIDLRIKKIRVERLQSMPPIDAVAEGVYKPGQLHWNHAEGPYAIAAYANKWDEINGPGSWEHNPWVRVIDFERIKP